MTNIVLCFDHSGESNATALFRRLDPTDQLGWHHHTKRRPQDVREAVRSAYDFLVEHWNPGDEVFVFGAGSGAAGAQALSRLLGTIGVLDGELRDYMLATYVLPRTERSAQDWRHVTEVAAGLAEHDDIAVPVRFLGLWDSTRIRGAAGAVEVVDGRHAIAIDGAPSLQRVEGVDEVWFRGTHRDILTGELTLEWMLDGAAQAGLRVDASPSVHVEPESSALTVGLRRLPADAAVHASVQMHVHSHPRYWRRLPALIAWSDVDWLDRGERLLTAAQSAPLRPQELATAS
ncbi:phospholipase effector Tle1 domain-containing protein [Mycobacterium sp. NPDC003323]